MENEQRRDYAALLNDRLAAAEDPEMLTVEFFSRQLRELGLRDTREMPEHTESDDEFYEPESDWEWTSDENVEDEKMTDNEKKIVSDETLENVSGGQVEMEVVALEEPECGQAFEASYRCESQRCFAQMDAGFVMPTLNFRVPCKPAEKIREQMNEIILPGEKMTFRVVKCRNGRKIYGRRNK